ncbi:hypothetical protein ACFQ0O_22905 [Saccharopolyspora spinosporotrichia]
MTQSRSPALSRRSALRLGAGLCALGPLAACAGPTGSPGPDTMTLALNRSLVSLDNKLNQFEAAVTVQRAVRQALVRIGPDLTPNRCWPSGSSSPSRRRGRCACARERVTPTAAR